MARFLPWEIGKGQYVWEKLNTQIRDVCLAIQIKNNSHFRFRSLFSFQKRLFWPKFSQLARKMSLNQFLLFFFLLKKRKSVYSSFQREIPCSRPLTVFFFLQKRLYWPKFSELTCKTWLKQFFLQRKNYSSFNGKFPAASLTPRLDYTFNFIFFSSDSTSCERSRLHRVLLNCGLADRGTSGTSVNMQICSRCALGEI